METSAVIASKNHFDIIIVGGGPAGSCAALSLARLRYRTLLVERAQFPRRHIGESLAPGIIAPLEQLGLPDRFHRFAVPTRKIRVRWERDDGDETGGSRRFNVSGFVVDRGQFDKMLLDAAQEAGTEVWQCAEVKRQDGGEPFPRSDGRSRIVVRRANASRVVLHARYVIDASGRRGILGGMVRRSAAPTLAIFGYWRSDDRNMLRVGETRIQAARWGWAWATRMPCGSCATATFSDVRTEMLGRPQSDRTLGSVLRRRLESLPLFQWSRKCRLEGSVRAVDCGSYCVSNLVGNGWIRVGEAAFAIDPLSAQGVQAAMRSGIQAATTVHTMLQKADRRDIARRFYCERTEEAIQFHSAAAASFYSRPARFANERFWQTRAAGANGAEIVQFRGGEQSLPPTTDCRVRLADGARWVTTTVIDGEFVSERQALRSPQIDRAVAFVGGEPVEELLRPLSEAPLASAELLRYWAARYGTQQSRRLWKFFVERMLLESLSSGSSERER